MPGRVGPHRQKDGTGRPARPGGPPAPPKGGPQPGLVSGLRAVIDEEHFTSEETVIEGRMCGKHTGEFLGFEPTDTEVVLPFVAFYRFDDRGKLTSERVVMNLAPLKP